MANKSFSVVMPTYTGKDQVADSLRRIIGQEGKLKAYETVVVVDGSEAVLKTVEAMKPEFKENGAPLNIIFNEHNMGHFESRVIGAKAAECEQLLFVDDRVKLDKKFFTYIGKSDEKTIMPNVLELETNNLISMTLNMLRRRVYGDKWGKKHEDYYLDRKNFESSPKGTTSLYIEKKIFLDACDEVKKGLNSSDTSNVNDDTKILEKVIDGGMRIFRPGNLTVYYSPRSGFKEAWTHLFKRGPKFVDYYHKPGTRFFPFLVLVYLSVLLILALAIFWPLWLLYLVLVSIIAVAIVSASISKTPRQFLVFLVGLPLVVITFSAGVLKGTLSKAMSR